MEGWKGGKAERWMEDSASGCKTLRFYVSITKLRPSLRSVTAALFEAVNLSARVLNAIEFVSQFSTGETVRGFAILGVAGTPAHRH